MREGRTDLRALRIAAFKVKKAIEVEGPSPARHHRIMREHRSEWPTLWEAIDELIRAQDVKR